VTERGTRFAILPAGASLVRIHRTEHDPLWFGPGPDEPPTYRFDAPDGSYGVCYLAHEPAGAFVETFLRDPELARPGIRILAASELRERGGGAVATEPDTAESCLDLAVGLQGGYPFVIDWEE
jgi:hypothetical protein